MQKPHFIITARFSVTNTPQSTFCCIGWTSEQSIYHVTTTKYKQVNKIINIAWMFVILRQGHTVVKYTLVRTMNMNAIWSTDKYDGCSPCCVSSIVLCFCCCYLIGHRQKFVFFSMLCRVDANFWLRYTFYLLVLCCISNLCFSIEWFRCEFSYKNNKQVFAIWGKASEFVSISVLMCMRKKFFANKCIFCEYM